MTKAFDKTLDAIADLEEAVTEARTQKLTADPEKVQDVIIEAVVVFQKHEKAL